MASTQSRKRDIPEGLWTKCKKCGNMIYDKELDANLKVCPKCQYHFPIGARERIHALVETCSFEESDASMESVDILKFTGVASYTAKLEQYTRRPTSRTPFAPALGRIGKYRVALGVMDFGFWAVRWDRSSAKSLTRLIEAATDKGLPVIIISTSGGARMYEGMFSLMQMAKTCGALAYHAKEQTALHQRADQSHHGGRHGQFRRRGRFNPGRTGGHDRFCRAARH
jgi:acetyl-CoA carboxylase carboxyl transferase subunit beta